MLNSLTSIPFKKTANINSDRQNTKLGSSKVGQDSYNPSFTGSEEQIKKSRNRMLSGFVGFAAILSSLAWSNLNNDTQTRVANVDSQEQKFLQSNLGVSSEDSINKILESVKNNKDKFFEDNGIDPNSEIAIEVGNKLTTLITKINQELTSKIKQAKNKEEQMSAIETFLENINVDKGQRKVIMEKIKPEIERFASQKNAEKLENQPLETITLLLSALLWTGFFAMPKS